jgi:hypothetical protein
MMANALAVISGNLKAQHAEEAQLIIIGIAKIAKKLLK